MMTFIHYKTIYYVICRNYNLINFIEANMVLFEKDIYFLGQSEFVNISFLSYQYDMIIYFNCIVKKWLEPSFCSLKSRDVIASKRHFLYE